MATNTTSLSNTPQAGDDSYRWTEEELKSSGLLSFFDGRTVVTLDVMANDLGGKAKKLFSIDDGLGDGGTTFLQQLLEKNVSTGWERTQGGNWIRIYEGKIQYDLAPSLTQYGGTVDGLGANDSIVDQFVYTIQLGNGTLSYATVTIEVLGLNDSPTDIVLSDNIIIENDDGGVVGSVTTTDADSNDTHTYSVDDTRFEVANGELKLKEGVSLNYETEQTITINITSSDGIDSVTKQFQIDVEDENEQPDAGADQYETVAENVAVGETLATVSASDPDEGGGNDDDNTFENLSYEITDGNAAGLFEIDADGNVKLAAGKSLDFETANQHVLTVTVTDGGGLSDTAQVTINVTDVSENHAPVAGNDRWFVSDNTTVIFPSAAFLANDTDIENDSLQLTALSLDGTTWVTDLNDTTPGNGSIQLDTTHGSLSVNVTTGVITYTTDNNNTSPTSSQFLTDSFHYRVSDGQLTDEGHVTAWVINIESGTGMDNVNLNNTPYLADAQSYSYIDLRNGDDQLTGSPGSDTFFGSGGNDIINVGALGPNDKIDGGGDGNVDLQLTTGDILVFDGNLDLTDISQDRITRIETLSMEDGSGGDTLTLNVNDVLGIGTGRFDPSGNTYGGQDAVRVNGDSDDTLNIVGAGWYGLSTVSNVPTGYTLYVNDASGTGASESAYILVQSQISVYLVN